MTPNAISPAVSRLHALAWRPGAEMHPGWWAALGLTAWRDSYAHPACRASIDRLIVARRGFPQRTLPPQLNASQSALVALEPRLDALMVALGLFAHGRPDYLLTQPYRTLLAAQLGEQGCVQLLALCRDRPVRGPDLSPDWLVDAVRGNGMRWWLTDAAECVATRLLSTVLPPSPSSPRWPTAPADNVRGRASDWLVKIGRFL
ncbi:type III secretion system subunit [Burkholderia ubonensis]|uniref:type III secretion system domain-containing protein n=1 Tax=Burkholderia ubonensis TaxID=101571 RepID=UPI0007577203|nr:type III secretion system domain-containing protein [Burkholderia ubonensis]KWC21387.1 type III secretion system subunit [Burkholderia ubonensis]KWC41549.1 type III secretion system subunit [Burkholderia ubonensis]